jgi:carbonic anhydrase
MGDPQMGTEAARNVGLPERECRHCGERSECWLFPAVCAYASATIMADLNHLLANNRAWAGEIKARDPKFFSNLAAVQNPEYLWIGCSDSRVPANQITGLMPGEVFVHRNVGNVVVHTDLNCLSVMQFAADVLCVKHIIVVGHYGCGGVLAALRNRRLGLSDNWLRHIQDVRHKHAELIERFPEERQGDALCELNVIEQVLNVGQTTVIRDAWERGQQLSIHGWIYGLDDGLLRDLKVSAAGASELELAYREAVAAIG